MSTEILSPGLGAAQSQPGPHAPGPRPVTGQANGGVGEVRSLGAAMKNSAAHARRSGVASRYGRALIAAIGGDWTLTGPTVLFLPLSRRKLLAVRAGALALVAALIFAIVGEISSRVYWMPPDPSYVVAAVIATVPLLLLPAGPVIAWRGALVATIVLAIVPGTDALSAIIVVMLAVTLFLAARSRPREEAVALWLVTSVAGLVVAGSASYFSVAGLASWAALIAAIAGLLCWTAQATRGRTVAQAASAHDRTVAIKEEERGVVLRERARIARELHDIVTHHLSGIAIQAQALPLRDPGLTEESRETLATIEKTTRQALTDLRYVIGMLRDEESAELREPQPTLRQVPALVARSHELGQSVSYGIDIQGPIPEAISMAAYRIVQESLTNSRRHAPGQPVTLAIRLDGPELRIEATNPLGADTDVAGAGHGIAGMRERASALGGSLSAGELDGEFKVAASLPVPEEQ